MADCQQIFLTPPQTNLLFLDRIQAEQVDKFEVTCNSIIVKPINSVKYLAITLDEDPSLWKCYAESIIKKMGIVDYVSGDYLSFLERKNS